MSSMRIGGLASGMDIDSLVEKLMTAERAPLDKLEQQKQTYEWQRDAYRDVNKKLTTFDTYIADNFILKSLNTKTATTSNSAFVEATATGSASGTLSIEGVTQLATAARKVGNMVNTTNGTVATASTKISELAGSNFTGTSEYSILLKSINATGTLATEATEIKFKASDSIDEVINKINSSKSGVVAFFENGKLSLTAENTGQLKDGGAEVQLVASQTAKDGQTITATGNELFSALGIGQSGSTDLVDGGTNAIFRVNGIDTERSSNRFTLNGYAVTLKETFNTNETLQNRIKSLNELISKTEAAKVQIDENISKLEGEVAKSKGDYDKLLASLEETQGYSAYMQLDEKSKVLLSSMEDEELAELERISLSSVETINTSTLTPDQKTLLKSFSPEQLAILENLSYENMKGIRDIVNEKNTSDSKVAELDTTKGQLTQTEADIAQYQKQLDEANDQLAKSPIDETAGKPVTLTATTNTDEIIDKIKDFVKTYNGLITDLKNSTNEAKYRDFKPLTTLQRKEMEEKEVELWEQKAKSGLLRNDSIIENGLSSLRSLIYQSNPDVANPKFNTLFNVGITTSKDYMSGGTLEIDENKLRAALEEDPDSVVKLFTGAGTTNATGTEGSGAQSADTRGFLRKIRSAMDVMEVKIDERAGRASMNETQFTLGKYLRDVNKRMDTWEDKLTAIESRYWTQFGAMEAMINKANNQSAMLMNQFA